ncbi:MAG: hypothetical protein KatS3mg111_3384 [Pirellulaceae bacterium]|nr:MAG: hypothetical protein KatS3mg111_3384 [Pirellulaceae bacterium]
MNAETFVPVLLLMTSTDNHNESHSSQMKHSPEMPRMVQRQMFPCSQYGQTVITTPSNHGNNFGKAVISIAGPILYDDLNQSLSVRPDRSPHVNDPYAVSITLEDSRPDASQPRLVDQPDKFIAIDIEHGMRSFCRIRR